MYRVGVLGTCSPRDLLVLKLPEVILVHFQLIINIKNFGQPNSQGGRDSSKEGKYPPVPPPPPPK